MSKQESSLWKKICKDPLLSSLIGVFGLLLVLALAVMLSGSVEACISQLFGVKDAEGVSKKYEALKSLVIVMGGIILVIQAWIANKRAKAMESAAQEQAKANENTEQGQRQERLKNAIEHLGNTSDSVRLGGAYELFHLAEDTAEDKKDLRQTVLDILCAHIRQTTDDSKYREKYESKPSEEVQSLLTLLFVQNHEVFKGLHVNLQESWLNGSNLGRARLVKAVLVRTRLHGADLRGAQVHGANLTAAQAHGADLRETQLHGANLRGAQVHGASLTETRLQGAFLGDAQLHGALLGRAQLHGAFLGDAQLHGAFLRGAQLHGASSHPKDSYELKLFEASIKEQIGKESDLSGAIFAGELTQEAVDSIGTGLSDEEANKLREKLVAHIGKPESNELPEHSGAITGAYTAQEAERWIAEYKKAMSEVPESDN